MGINREINVMIGWDARETVASSVLAHSIKKRTKSPLNISYLKHRELRKQGCFARPWLIDGATGDFIDMIDGRPFSTEFSHTRFLVPHLMGYKGWALFVDADMVFLSDIKKLFELCDDKYAVMCVKHNHIPTANSIKMDGREQLRYHRKNWSSFVLWNCGHPANSGLTPERVNFAKGGELHAFSWLQDYQIGEIPFTYNYICGVSPKLPSNSSGMPAGKPAVIHYTEGGPWFESCMEVPYAGVWLDEYEDWQSNGEHTNISSAPTSAYEHKKRKPFVLDEYAVPDGVELPEMEILPE